MASLIYDCLDCGNFGSGDVDTCPVCGSSHITYEFDEEIESDEGELDDAE